MSWIGAEVNMATADDDVELTNDNVDGVMRPSRKLFASTPLVIDGTDVPGGWMFGGWGFL
jgi:hypothetical protein